MVSNQDDSKKKDKEYNAVAEAFNWEQRVKDEYKAAQVWPKMWGTLFENYEQQSTYDDYNTKIAKLEAEMKTLPVQGIMTNSQLSYLNVKPYRELRKYYRQKAIGKSDNVELLEGETLDPAFKPYH